MPSYSYIGNVPGAWRSGSIASDASAAISRFGSYNPATDHRLSSGQLIRTSNPADRAAIEARSQSLGAALGGYDRNRSAFDAGPRTNSYAHSELLGQASALRANVADYNHDAAIFNSSPATQG